MLVLKYFCEVNTKQIFFPNVAFCVLLCLLNAVQLRGQLHLGELALVLLRRDVSTDLSGAPVKVSQTEGRGVRRILTGHSRWPESSL